MSEWISVEDRLPAVSRDVLILLGHALVERGYWYEQHTPIDGWYFRGSRVDNVTHWQPLPAFPASPVSEPESGEQSR
jgi:hypothetical protein